MEPKDLMSQSVVDEMAIGVLTITTHLVSVCSLPLFISITITASMSEL